MHNMRQKNLFESYMPPSPVMSRCYSSKSNIEPFTTHIPGNSLFNMNKYLGNVGNFNKKNHGVGHPGLKMPLVKGSGYESGVDPIAKHVGGFVGSKSQAGSSNHRGREFSLGDFILDKIIDLMEQQKQPAAKKWEGGGKTMPKIPGFAMIDVSSFSGVNDSNYLRCVGPKWSSVPQEFDASSCMIQFPELSVFNGLKCEAERCSTYNTDKSETGDAPETHFNAKSPEECVSPDHTDCSLNSSDSTIDSFSPGQYVFDQLTPPSSVESCCESSNGLKCEAERCSTYDTDRSETGDAPETHFNAKSPEECVSPDHTDCSLNSSDSTIDSFSPGQYVFDQLTPPPSVESCCESSYPTPDEPCVGAINKLEPNANDHPIVQSSPVIQTPWQRLISESEDESIPSDVLSSSLESHSADTFLPHRTVQRSISECSADSDDSFIVFESTEDESVIFDESDDDDSSSDEDLDEIDNCILISHNCAFSAPQQTLSRLEEANRKWNKTYGGALVRSTDDCTSKKVKFAEGKNLTRVKRLVTWDFAHRAARIGPWEMYLRDSVRFKARISTLSSVISPVLAPKHRKKIYSLRFKT